MRRRGLIALVAGVSALSACAGPIGAVTVSGPDPAVEKWPRWPYPASCGTATFDPVTVFRGPTGAEEGSSPSAVALRGVLYDPALAWLGLPQHDWRLVHEDSETAEFIWGRLAKGMQRVTLQNSGEGWKLSGNGTCEIHSVIRGAWAVNWSLAVDHSPLGKNTRRVRIDLSGGPCSSGRSQNDRAHPIFRQMGRKLLLSILVDPPLPGPQTCEGIVEPPLVVKLPGRLGKRKLYDGGTYPPRLGEPRKIPARLEN
jgi:hypothetical protein